jgi:hypothetical protein
MNEEEQPRLYMESMAYMIMEHYGWTLREVNELSMDELKQVVTWAIAMNRQPSAPTEGDVVHLGYDIVPPVS